MLIGSGQLAIVFDSYLNDEKILIFASGVANSNCTDSKEFKREEKLLLQALSENEHTKFVYFSSCALSAVNYKKNAYYIHKSNMENLVKRHAKNYYIFRIPQLFGELKKHNTLINFLYDSIKNKKIFQVYDEAYRYVIEINDVRKIVENYLNYSRGNCTIDIANNYRYKVLEIVYIFEKILDAKALYEVIHKEDKYVLNLSECMQFVNKYNVDVGFGKEYLEVKLRDKIKQR